MKKLLAIFSLFATLLTFTACGDLEEPDFGDQIYASELSGLWRWTSNDDYSSIEFVDLQYYFVTKDDGSVVYGSFRKTDDKQFTLSGFGVIDISTCNGSYIYFDLTLDDAEMSMTQTVSWSSLNESDGYTSDNSYLLSTLWEPISSSDIKYILFTTASTFMVVNSAGELSRGSWWWEDDSTTAGVVGYSINGVSGSSELTISNLSVSNATIKYDGTTYNLIPCSGSL